jgi:hypothetical protein
MIVNPLVPEATLDQDIVKAHVKRGESLRIVAHAGTGKTSTLLWSFIGDARKVLFLEYNRDLRLEAKEKAREAGLLTVSVHNYDSFLVEFYDPAAPSRDFQLALQRVLREDIKPLEDFSFEVLVVDEAQDMTDAYARFLQKILNDNAFESPQLILAGDPKQTIYAFRGATTEYLVGKEWGWTRAKGPPRDLSLAETFRFGDSLCNFVNAFCSCLFKKSIWGTDIISGFPGGVVELWDFDGHSNAEALVARYLDAASKGSLCILSSSVREENLLLKSFLELTSRAGLPPAEEERSDRPILRTVHTSKGKQYNTVFLFVSQTDMWLTPMERLKSEKNTLLYVGCTRARTNLILVESSDEKIITAIFKKKSNGWAGDGIFPVSKCANTGSSDPPRTISVATRLIPPISKATLAVMDKKLSIDDKESILSSVSFCIKKFSDPIQDISSDEELLVRMRSDWNGAPDSMNPLWPLLIWAWKGKPVDVRIAYARLARKTPRHLFLEKFEEPLKSISSSLNEWGSWETLMHFHPLRRYGHSAQTQEPPNHLKCNLLYSAFIECFGGLEAVPFSQLQSPTSAWTTCSHDHKFYLDVKRQTVLTPVFCNTEATRPLDVFACIIAAGRLDLQYAGIVYLQRGVEVLIRVPKSAVTRAENLMKQNDRYS